MTRMGMEVDVANAKKLTLNSCIEINYMSVHLQSG
jgi:hypothetical protein